MKHIRNLTLLVLLLILLPDETRAQYLTNKQAVTRFFEEVMNKYDMFVINEVVSDQYVFHNTLSPAEKYNKRQMKEFLPAFIYAFPDLRCSIEDIVAEDDRVAVRLVFTGTQKNEIWGIQPTNRPISHLGEVFFRLESGKIVESWMRLDFAGLLTKMQSEG